MSELEFWKDLGNIFDAVLNYQKKNVEFNNRFINPWIRLGNIFERQDQANDAVQAYQRATEIDPDNSQNWVDLGDAQFKKGEYDGAIEAYRKAVILDPEAGWPLGNLALSLVSQGKIEEAIPLYKKSIDLLIEIEDKAICWNRLGNAYRKLNDYENAFLAFQKADQLDGENTGFNDKLDETPPSLSMVAPEEILEQMVVEQPQEEFETESVALEVVNETEEETGQPEIELATMEITQTETTDEPISLLPNEEGETESTSLEVVNEVAKEFSQPEVVNEVAEEFSQPEVELATLEVTQPEATDEVIALAPNMEMIVEENSLSEEEVTLPLVNNETNVDEPANENDMAEEESPLTLHEKKFDLLQIVENVIAKVERAYTEKKFTAVDEDQLAEEVTAEIELSVVSEESGQDVQTVNAVSEEAVLEVESIAETNAEVAFEDNSVAEVQEEAALEVDTADMSEKVSLEEVVAPTTSEEVTLEVESMAAELNEEAEPEVETPIAPEVRSEEEVSEDTPRRIPEWLVIQDTVKAEEKSLAVETEGQPEPEQIESVTTLSDISQEAAISESIVNMDIVETYTDTLAAQLVTESSLNEESIPVVASSQVEENPVESDAVIEAQEMVAVDESNPVEEPVIAEETSTVVVEEEVAELAYEEYLKDMAGPAKSLTDHVDEIQGEVPVTKVSKNGEVRIAMDTKNAHVWNELGNIYLNAGTYDDAIASYSKAIELDRHFAWPYSNLALAYVQKGRFAEAILLYQRGIELFTLDRDKAITWNRLGNVYRRINDYANAIASYQTADELDPENATLSLRSSFGLLGNMYSDSKPAYVA